MIYHIVGHDTALNMKRSERNRADLSEMEPKRCAGVHIARYRARIAMNHRSYGGSVYLPYGLHMLIGQWERTKKGTDREVKRYLSAKDLGKKTESADAKGKESLMGTKNTVIRAKSDLSSCAAFAGPWRSAGHCRAGPCQ